MPEAKFKVRVHYQSNTYQIVAEDHKYSSMGCICNTISAVMDKMFQITDKLSKQGVKATFTFVNAKEDK